MFTPSLHTFNGRMYCPTLLILGLTGYSQWNVGVSVIVPILILNFQKHHVSTSDLHHEKICVMFPGWDTWEDLQPTYRLKDILPPPTPKLWLNYFGPADCGCENMFIVVCHWDFVVVVSYDNHCLIQSGWITLKNNNDFLYYMHCSSMCALHFIFSYM